MTVPFSDLQSAAPSAVIELFSIEVFTAKHGFSNVYRFHSGSGMNLGNSIIWGGSTYLRFPIEADGFEWNGTGSFPRPKLRASNVFGEITAIIQSTSRKSLDGARLTRIRTLARYLDGANWPGGTNPLGTPDNTAEFPREIYALDQKTLENPEIVEYECASLLDLAGVRAPKRLCMSWCQWIYKQDGCGYSPINSFTSGTYVKASTTSNGATVWVVTVTYANHGLQAGEYIYLDVTSGSLQDDYYLVRSVTTNSFTVVSNMAGATSGTVRGTQFYSETNVPTWTASEDKCSKRLDGCKLRFGSNSNLPFGGFPGVGQFYA